jgi:LemA protein
MEPFTTFIWKRILIQVGGVIVIAVILGGFVLAYNISYNNAVNLDQQADEQWVRITHDLVERYGGIPALAEYLGSSMGSDVSALDQVTRNLSRWRVALSEGGIGKINTETTNLEVSITSLTMVLKGHPGIAASGGVRDFMSDLERTDADISADRLSYDEAVQLYNRAINSFPASLWASNWGFSWREYFTARIGTREPPPVPED